LRGDEDRSDWPDDLSEDVIIGNDVRTGERVALPYQRRDLGVAIIGRSGTGKSSILERLILADLTQGTPGLVIDPHGRLAERVITLAPSSAASRIVLLEPSITEPFGLNLLACREPIDDEDDPVSWAADSVVATVKKLYGEQDEYLPRLEHYLDLAARTLIPNNRTLADAPRLFRNDGFRRACLKRVADRDVAEDWVLYDSLRGTDQVAHIEAVINRLSRLLRPKIIQGIVGSVTTTIPFEDVLEGDAMMILSLPSERLTPERCNFIGAMVLCALADQVFARSVTREVRRVHLYLDEYQRFATSTTAELLTQGRKYGVGVTLAHQGRGQISDAGVSAAELQAGTLIILAVTRQDADVLAGELPVTQREEWVEEVELQDGTEAEMVPTRTPGLSANRHRIPTIASAGRQLFEVAVERPGQRIYGDAPHVAVSPEDPAINQLLVDVMDGKVTGTKQLRGRLLDIVFLFAEAGSSKDARRYSGSLAPRNYYLPYNMGWFSEDVPDVMNQLSSWLDVYLNNAHSAETVRRRICDDANKKLYEYARRQQESEKSWTATKSVYGSSRQEAVLMDIEKKHRLEYLRQTVEVMGQRFDALLILCEGLSADPLLVESGQQKARTRMQLVVHPRQPEQDARNELAGRLVNPSKDYVAHIRLPGSRYHEVKLSAPVSGIGNFEQLEEVRRRSRTESATSREEVVSNGLDESPRDEEPLTIGRRPPKR
jgi:hypothetical protein